MEEGDRPVTRKEFNTFLDNHFWHLRYDVSRIKGALYVLVPLMITTLAIVVSLAVR